MANQTNYYRKPITFDADVIHVHPIKTLRAKKDEWAIFHRGIQICDSSPYIANIRAVSVDMGLVGYNEAGSRIWKAPDYQLAQIGKPVYRNPDTKEEW